MTFGHRFKQINPLKGMLYIIACFLFGLAMWKLGVSTGNGILEDTLLGCVFFITAVCVWAVGFVLLWDLFKYFKSN